MATTIQIEDPGAPEILAMLEDGEAFAASLYPAESNHFPSIDALRSSQIRFFVARDRHGQPLGTGAVALNDGWAEIKRMWVIPAARGRGLSRAILEHLETEVRSAGISLIRLETGISNRDALALYERAGFERRPPFADYRPDPLSVFMEKRLP
ncbi:GNAT family N-acetyltransferase [Methylobacterium terricola]|uniref:GNAT family N-acetyltransferase n=1 Tax=Methylobacterium terricola TaxID=2583531 RepID=A0A5C4LFD2_9HYPH|nr:GNAT family N-acetyltransferase [Methylobacterium terricola]TNC11726.1 GNAT family N-acetyltransferase [Methylobacterium terricola]